MIIELREVDGYSILISCITHENIYGSWRHRNKLLCMGEAIKKRNYSSKITDVLQFIRDVLDKVPKVD